MTGLWEFVLRHGYGLMFVAVLIEQLGAPVPAVPVLLAMGGLAGLGYYSLPTALLLSLIATLAADLLWFELGRRRGDSILALLCRLSLEPDTCVNSTSRTFERWGPATLLIAKFIPGLSTVAPPLAGSAGISRLRFLLYDSIGTLLWAGAALGAGYLLRREVAIAADWLSRFGLGMLVLAISPLATWIFYKLWQRERAMRLFRVGRIYPDELKQRLDDGEPTWIIDLRSPRSIQLTGGRIPGARVLPESEVRPHLRDLPAGAHLVFYCS
jgi:membrane protein DedA with SNARE-associated domain